MVSIVISYYCIVKSNVMSEMQKRDLKKRIFKGFQRYALLRGLEKTLGLQTDDMKKYLRGWESKL